MRRRVTISATKLPNRLYYTGVDGMLDVKPKGEKPNLTQAIFRNTGLTDSATLLPIYDLVEFRNI
jgi:hypothetical protein